MSFTRSPTISSTRRLIELPFAFGAEDRWSLTFDVATENPRHSDRIMLEIELPCTKGLW